LSKGDLGRTKLTATIAREGNVDVALCSRSAIAGQGDTIENERGWNAGRASCSSTWPNFNIAGWGAFK
jgi:hypothetical protein